MHDAGLDATVVDAFALIGGELDDVQKQIAHIDSAMTLVATLVSEGTPVRAHISLGFFSFQFISILDQAKFNHTVLKHCFWVC
jgi:hypothetical protein